MLWAIFMSVIIGTIAVLVYVESRSPPPPKE